MNKERVMQVLHWAVYPYYVYVFGYASLFKVFQKKSMMDGMLAFGFNRSWTLLIGYGELLGFVGLLAGIWHRQIKNASVLWLFPFAVGALMVHFAHNDYRHYFNALYCCLAPIVLLATDKHFKLVL